jgi:hypothetical protein
MQTQRHFRYLLAAKILIALITIIAWAAPSDKDKSAGPLTVRWGEGKPGCTFARGDDGKYRYGMSSDDMGITLAVDSRELQRSRRHFNPFFGVLLTVRYTGPNTLQVRNDNIRLEFVKHSNVVQTNLDPEDFSAQYQEDVEALVKEKKRQLKKHPEKQQEVETLLKPYQDELLEVQNFLCDRSLRHVTLDRKTPETNGWVFFSTTNKWIGPWKEREDFVLRIPLKNRVFEFPFSLPPIAGDLILRRRPQH